MKYCIGIDPGKYGAIALLSLDKSDYMVFDYQEDIPTTAKLIRNLHIERDVVFAMIEKVHSMPKQGIASAFKFGGNYFSWQMSLSVLSIPYDLVTPFKWQKLILDSGSGESKDTKTRSLNTARRRYPEAELHLKKHDGRADALNLAEYAVRHWLLISSNKPEKIKRNRL